MKRSSRPTQHDIARAAGVSPAVVSLVINGRANGKVRISQATQDRVQAAIRELGYVPNLAARQLAGGSTHVIGIFTYEPFFPMQANSFYQPFLVGIEEQAAISDYNLLLFTRGKAGNVPKIYRGGVNQLLATEGAILLGTNEDRRELTRLRRDGFPFVFVGRREIEGEPIACTAADYAGGTSTLIQQLLDNGHRKILYLGLAMHNESAIDRERGFFQAMTRAGIDHPGGMVERTALESINTDWLRARIGEGYTAIAVEQMAATLTLLELAESLGLTIPDDLSVVALGKADDPTQDHYDIDTFYIPHREMGAQAVSLLARMLTEPDVDTSHPITIPCPPAPGRTIGPVSRKEVTQPS